MKQTRLAASLILLRYLGRISHTKGYGIQNIKGVEKVVSHVILKDDPKRAS